MKDEEMLAAGRTLQGRVVALPETRQLAILADLLQARGARVIKVPMVAIHDAPDPVPVLTWLEDFMANPPDDFIILTGEGLRRLLAFAARHQQQEKFVAALAKTRKLCRGPKPERALREVGLKSDMRAIQPTTDGVISTLDGWMLEGRRIAIQLYGMDPNLRLRTYLENRQAVVTTVAPYVYADQAEEKKVAELILDLAEGRIDVIAFTSQPQFTRLQQVARARQLEKQLQVGMERSRVAAVGPLVKAQLQAAGVRVDIMPETAFSMKPLVNAIARSLAPRLIKNET
ncbi:MAG: uroporphyrinogen-III synthase [Pseudomonadales bacterium]|nr:uroporphyrinogen-III synthase [Pseudomonadales bacterium]